MFLGDDPGGDGGEDRLEADEDGGVGGRGVLLGPGLGGETEGGGAEGGDQDGDDQRGAGMPVRVFEAGEGEEWNGDGGEDGGGGDLDDGERADGMMLDVTADDDHVQRERDRAAEDDGIAAIEAAEAFGRDGKKIQTGESGDGAGPDPVD